RSRQKLDRFQRHQQGRNIAIHARPQPQQTVGIISQRPSTIPEQPAAVTATTSEPQFERRLASAAQVFSGPWSLVPFRRPSSAAPKRTYEFVDSTAHPA